MFKKSILPSSLALALVAPSFVMAEIEATVELKNETAIFASSGQTIGQAKTMLDTTDHSGGDVMKFQNQARIFLNGYIGEDSSWHAELQIIHDPEATDSSGSGGVNYQDHEIYTQNDYFRELYVDTEAAGWALRLGKQQVVWGTADGIKLLDIINPTDFRELNQNAMEDSRIPVWMINAERDIGDNGNFQFVVSQAERNKIPGLNPGGDSGHPFIMKGVDTISGQVGGFYNVAPALSNVAGSFSAAAAGGLFAGNAFPNGLAGFAGLTVDGFASAIVDSVDLDNDGIGDVILMNMPGFDSFAGNTYGDGDANQQLLPGYIPLNNIAQNGLFAGDPNGNNNTTRLLDVTGPMPNEVNWNPGATTSKAAFDHMTNATFATFNTFSSIDPLSPTGFTGTTTEWVRDTPDEPNAGFRYKGNLDSGLNFSVNYFYHYGANPALDLSWRDANGNALVEEYAPTNLAGQPVPTGTGLTRDQARANLDLGNPTTLLVHDGTGTTYYGAYNVLTGNPGVGAPTLRFTESYYRVHSLGASFDMAVDSMDIPLVLRGEFLYDKDEKQPVVDKYLLSIGDLTNALKMEDADYFKYVLGADVTVMTNLLVSAQFIQFINLDYIDSPDTCTTQAFNAVDCSRYTADFATMSMTNGLNKAEEYKEFVSLFLSKPIGEDQLGRWNNIIIWEEGGGWWNRLDAEYSLTDQFIISGEWNQYWGDENTTFGQFEESSNVQVGFKYIFEDY